MLEIKNTRVFFFFNDTATTEIYTLSLHDALPISIIRENERLRKENDALSGKVASLEQSLYWLRKKMFGRMSEKNLPLDPNQLSLFTQQEMSSDEKIGRAHV